VHFLLLAGYTDRHAEHPAARNELRRRGASHPLRRTGGESLTDAIIHSLEERLERVKGRRSAPDLAETLMAISRRSSALPDLDTRSADEILGYDEKGAFR
jgi:antitoxin VapB